MKKFSYIWNQYEGLHKYTFGDAIRLCQLHTRQGVITYQSFGLNEKSTAIAMLFLVPEAGLDGVATLCRQAATIVFAFGEGELIKA